MTDFLEYPKAIYSPTGEELRADDAEQEAAMRAQWAAPVEEEESPAEQDEPVRRRGRPPKVR